VHPIFASYARLALYLAIWIPAAALVTIEFATVGALPWAAAAVMAVPLSIAYAFVCLAAWYPCRATPLQTSGAARIGLTHATAATLSSGLWLMLGSAWARALAGFGYSTPFERFGDQAPVLFVTGVLLFVLSVFAHYLLISYEAAQQSETRSLELDVLARDAQLTALRAQVNPHFLFNSLHSIASLIGSDQAGARRMCVLLADFLRDSVRFGGRDQITLSQEFSLVRQYLAIEQIRFGRRLVVLDDLPPRLEQTLVPPLLLQPLVENAVKHGIAGLIDGGTVTVRAREDGADLVLAVENPYDADRPITSSTRVGLQNVKRRLETEFGPKSSVRLVEREGTYQAEIRLPAASSAAAAGPLDADRHAAGQKIGAQSSAVVR
jgi:two-component system, LytTR family, sensor histidine kinase AlgZ